MKLIALNLPRNLSEEELKNIFAEHGDVTECTLVMDEKTGGSKGFAFIEMERDEDAMIAIEKLHGTRVNRSKIRVKQAE